MPMPLTANWSRRSWSVPAEKALWPALLSMSFRSRPPSPRSAPSSAARLLTLACESLSMTTRICWLVQSGRANRRMLLRTGSRGTRFLGTAGGADCVPACGARAGQTAAGPASPPASREPPPAADARSKGRSLFAMPVPSSLDPAGVRWSQSFLSQHLTFSGQHGTSRAVSTKRTQPARDEDDGQVAISRSFAFKTSLREEMVSGDTLYMTCSFCRSNAVKAPGLSCHVGGTARAAVFSPSLWHASWSLSASVPDSPFTTSTVPAMMMTKSKGPRVLAKRSSPSPRRPLPSRMSLLVSAPAIVLALTLPRPHPTTSVKTPSRPRASTIVREYGSPAGHPNVRLSP
mmetsp:Transcript_6208/g.18621  ORF Transcript_6208/g.18621 Transcript_6208/m.18621 type:complete len:345 (-) Transcript_6208:537-1571(-)